MSAQAMTGTRHLSSGSSVNLCLDCCQVKVVVIDHRCSNCQSPRLVSHPELDQLCLAHIDCDSFFASVEKLDNPDLQDKPVIVGGGKRGVVSTCCYIARIRGVRSAMPMYQALKACPDAVVIKPRMERYRELSKTIKAEMLTLTPLVQSISIDEAFLDLSGTEMLHGTSPAATLAQFAHRIEHELGLTISIGLSGNRFLAKIASDLNKPRGFSILSPSDAKEFLASKPVTIIPGVGPAFAKKLKSKGIHTLNQIQNLDEKQVALTFGTSGHHLWLMSQGIDPRDNIDSKTIIDSKTMQKSREVKSVSHETTFSEDQSNPEVLSKALLRLCEKVTARLKDKQMVGHGVCLKLKYKNFKLITRSKHLNTPTQLAHVVFETADQLLRNEVGEGQEFRLLGVAVTGIEDAIESDQFDMLEGEHSKEHLAEQAMDRVRSKFGDDAVIRGKLL